jgi:hypothetical protein
MDEKQEKVSVMREMTDRNGREEEKSVRHKSDDGQKWTRRRKKCPS